MVNCMLLAAKRAQSFVKQKQTDFFEEKEVDTPIDSAGGDTII